MHFSAADREPGTGRLTNVWGKLELAAGRGWRRSKGSDMDELTVTGCCQAALRGTFWAGLSCSLRRKNPFLSFSVGDHWKHDGRQLGVTAEKTVRESL